MRNPGLRSISDETTALIPSISVTPRILIVDDEDVVCAVLRDELDSAGYTVTTAPSGEAALECLRTDFAPLVILDRNLPGMDGLEVCRRIRAQKFPGYVFIILRTIQDGEADIIEGFESGADDYISKETSIAQLLARLKTARRILSLEQALKHMLSERRTMSLTDALTGAYNRRYFMKYGAREVLRAQQAGAELTVLALDIDNFKTINDRHGHDAGDAVLVDSVRRIRALLGRNEWCARLGGEEFAVLLPRSDLKRGRRVAERIRLAFSKAAFRASEVDIAVTLSVGVGGFGGFEDPDKIDIKALLRQADECLYRSKRTGRNKVTMTSPMIRA